MTELRLGPGVPVLLAIVCKLRMIRSLRRRKSAPARAKTERGRSSGVEHNLAKVGVGRSNRLARSSFLRPFGDAALSPIVGTAHNHQL